MKFHKLMLGVLGAIIGVYALVFAVEGIIKAFGQ
jgi:hypothetical protein